MLTHVIVDYAQQTGGQLSVESTLTFKCDDSKGILLQLFLIVLLC